MKKEERKALLKELGYSKEDMVRFWNECVELGVPVVKMLDKAGWTWKDLTENQLRQLPTVKETWLKKQDQVRESVSVKECAPTEELTFEEEMFQKIQSGTNLSERELRELVWSGLDVDEIEGDSLRWTKCMTTIVKLCGHYYSIDWDKGLTECQENSFTNQPEEVKPVEKIVKTTDWVGIDKEIKKGSVYKELPCEIGDYVWVVNDVCVHKEKVYGFYIGKDESKSVVYTEFPSVEKPGSTRNSSFGFSNWGVNVFPEAEKDKADALLLEKQKMQDIKNTDYEDDFEEDL